MTDEPKIKAVLSDGGRILYDDRVRRDEFLDYLKKMGAVGPNYKSRRTSYSKPKSEEDRLPPGEFRSETTSDELEKRLMNYIAKARVNKTYDREDAYRDVLRDIGRPELYQSYEKWVKGKRRKTSLYPGIKHVVKSLKKKGIKFIIATDATKGGDYLDDAIRRIGLDEGLTGVVSSKDVGKTKPSKEFFSTVEKKYGLKPEECLFVGHDLDELEGAHKRGYQTAALNYDPDENLDFIPKKRKLKRFRELLKLLKIKPKPFS